ncbi:GNAT family N-acetyltransferase [Armatimonas sp.]|uniref:GNAT family N-acetyltransferase n=1 Tax=Armatimonas sp. TaxID=1872638 RepID=UPI00375070F3
MIKTNRLLLRRWLPSDAVPFAALNADPRVMEFFPSTLTPAESDAMVGRIEAHFDEKGFGLWAVEVPEVAAFIGFIGLSTPRFTAHFTPCIEIGWRLAYEHWGHGYATEGAKAALIFAFNTLKLPEVVAMTAVDNQRSRNVIEKLGMTHSESDDFDHPLLPVGHPLTRHVLYRIVPPLGGG